MEIAPRYALLTLLTLLTLFVYTVNAIHTALRCCLNSRMHAYIYFKVRLGRFMSKMLGEWSGWISLGLL